MSCPTIEQLRSLLDATAGDALAVQLQLHLEGCESCQRALDALVADGGFWNDAAKQLADKPSVTPALQEAVEHLQDASPTDDRPLDYYEHALPFVGPPVEPGTIGRLKHYDILHVAGRGGMGVVVKAFDRALRRVVAIKLLAPHLASNGLARQRFVREGRATAAIAHEHVVTIHAVEEQPPFLVMQYVQGETLQARLDRCGPLELKEVLRVGKQIAEGLGAAHEQGVVHRDIKPANILLENGISRVKLTDFGLARAMDDASLTHSGVVAGTPQFMAPEQANGDAIDHRADLFSLGSVLYTMCVGHAPFRASTAMGVLRRVAEHSARPVREINPEIPEWLAALINRLHAKRPEDRPQSALEVAEELGRRLASLQSATARTTSDSATEFSPRPGTPGRGAGGEGQSDLPNESLPSAASNGPSPLTPLPGVPGRGGQDVDRQSSLAAKAVRNTTGFVMPDRLTLLVIALVIASTVMVAAGALGRAASEIAAVTFIGATLIGVAALGLRWLFSTRVRAYLPQTIAGCLFWVVAWLAPGVLAALFVEDRMVQAAFRMRHGGEISAVLAAANQSAQFTLLAAIGCYLLVASLWFRRRVPQGGPVFSKKQRVSGWVLTSAIIGVTASFYALIWYETVSAIAAAEAMQREAIAHAEQAKAAHEAQVNSKTGPLQVQFPKFADGVSVRLSHRNGTVTIYPGSRAETLRLPIGSVNWTAFVSGRSYASGVLTVIKSQLPKYPPTGLHVPSPIRQLLEGFWIVRSNDSSRGPSFKFHDQFVDLDQTSNGKRVLKSFLVQLNAHTDPAEIDLVDLEEPQFSKHGLLRFDGTTPVLALCSTSRPRPSNFGPFPHEPTNAAGLHAVTEYRLVREDVAQQSIATLSPSARNPVAEFEGLPPAAGLVPDPFAVPGEPAMPQVELEVVFPKKSPDLKFMMALKNDPFSPTEHVPSDELRKTLRRNCGTYAWLATFKGNVIAKGEISLHPALPTGKRPRIEIPLPTTLMLMQGRWKCSATSNGVSLANGFMEVVEDAVLIATPTRQNLTDVIRHRFTIKFDDSTSPTSVDLTDSLGQRRRGISEVGKDSIKMSFAVGDALRPFDFGRDDRTEEWQLQRDDKTTRLEDDLPVEPLTHGATAEVIVARQREHAKRLKLATSRMNKHGVELVLLPECAVTDGDLNASGLATIKWPELTPVEAASRGSSSNMTEAQLKRTHKIGPLAIAASPITVKQFLQFVAETKHVTEAERDAVGSWVLGEDNKLSLKPKTTWRPSVSPPSPIEPVIVQGIPEAELNAPVSHLSWNDATAYCEWLSNKEGRQYRLPMAAELVALSQLTLKTSPDRSQRKSTRQPDTFDLDSSLEPSVTTERLLDIDWFGRQTRSNTPLKPVVEATLNGTTTSILEAEWTQTYAFEEGFKMCFGLGVTTNSDGSMKATANSNHIAEPSFRCERLGFRVVAELNSLREE